MSKKWTFIEHATDHLLRPKLGDKKHPTLWPSEASALVVNEYGEEQVVGKCRRATFFRYMVDSFHFDDKYLFYEALVDEISFKKLPPDRYMLWIWRAGELYEDYLIRLAQESGVYIADQVRVYIQPNNVSGLIDLKIINPDTHKYSNVEVKSVYGFGGNFVLGTPSARKAGKLGTPRESNLMQIALYDWRTASEDNQHENSRLVYGSRDTGRYAEYEVDTRKDPNTGITHIYYQGAAPNETKEVQSPITIDSILEQYKYVQDSVDSGTIPERDFDLTYTEEQIDTLFERKQLNKAEMERHAKRKEYLAGTRKRKIGLVQKGDWQCNLCSFKNICYAQDGSPRTI